jgi:hypothetical protein
MLRDGGGYAPHPGFLAQKFALTFPSSSPSRSDDGSICTDRPPSSPSYPSLATEQPSIAGKVRYRILRFPPLSLELTQILVDAGACRFHDPTGVSVWTNSSSVAAFSQWSAAQTNSGSTTPLVPSATADEHDPSARTVYTATGSVVLPTLITPRFAQGKAIRYVVLFFLLFFRRLLERKLTFNNSAPPRLPRLLV